MKIEGVKQWVAVAGSIAALVGTLTGGVVWYVGVSVRAELVTVREQIAADRTQMMLDQATLRREMREDFSSELQRVVDVLLASRDD